MDITGLKSLHVPKNISYDDDGDDDLSTVKRKRVNLEGSFDLGHVKASRMRVSVTHVNHTKALEMSDSEPDAPVDPNASWWEGRKQ